MRKLIVLFLLLAGCASQPAQLDTAKDARNSASVHTELGAGYYGRGQYAVAIQELKDAVKADPTYAQAYNVLGLVYMTLKEDDEAGQNFEHAYSLSPKDSDINNNYGWFLCQTHREVQSIRHFLTAVANPLYSTPEKAYLNAGICSEKMGEQSNAEKYYRDALQIQPSIPQANLGLARIYFGEKQYGLARRYLSRYMLMGEPTAESLWLGVRIEHALGGSDLESDYETQLKHRFPESREAQQLNDGKFQ